ncbi:MAG: hypothetical protein PF636_10985 [Actinomycetota bacterium]|jgi:hypothetical protein|nr:hypothetical protein [Actinomycetota bacterium]
MQTFVATVSALIGGAPIIRTELALHIADAMISPVWVVGGVLLWRRKAFGYVAGLGLLFQASMLFVGLIIVLLIQPLMTTASFAPIDILVVFAMSIICFIPLGLFTRGAVKNT